MVIAAIAAFSFAGCGGDGDSAPDYSKYAGTYKFKKYVHEIGVTKTYNVGDTLDGVTLTADYFVMILGDDGKFTVNSPLAENDATLTPYGNQIHGNMTGTWKPRDYGIDVTIGDEDIRSIYINETEITYSFSGVGLIMHTYYLEKAAA